MRIAQEEIFGPTTRRSSGSTTRTRRSASRTGSATGSPRRSSRRDVNRAFRAMRDLEAGITYINAGTIGAEVHLPFGGDEGDRQRPPRGRPGGARRLHRVEVGLRRLLGHAPARADRQRVTEKVNLAETLASSTRRSSRGSSAHYNDSKIMVAKTRGEFVWHSHPDTDDFFLVLDGRLTIQLRDRDVELGPGEMYVVPRGVEHCPRAEPEAHILLIEPTGTPNTGDSTEREAAPERRALRRVKLVWFVPADALDATRDAVFDGRRRADRRVRALLVVHGRHGDVPRRRGDRPGDRGAREGGARAGAPGRDRRPRRVARRRGRRAPRARIPTRSPRTTSTRWSTREGDALHRRRLARESRPRGVRASCSRPTTAPCSTRAASRSASRRTTSPSTARSSRDSSARSSAGVDELEVVSDSELLVKQMRGEYKVKNAALRELSLEAARLARELGRVTLHGGPPRAQRARGQPRQRGARYLAQTAAPLRGSRSRKCAIAS